MFITKIREESKMNKNQLLPNTFLHLIINFLPLLSEYGFLSLLAIILANKYREEPHISFINRVISSPCFTTLTINVPGSIKLN